MLVIYSNKNESTENWEKTDQFQNKNVFKYIIFKYILR